MNAVILAGGGGARLRPLTYATPKSLIPVVNRPLLHHLIANLQRHGVDNIVVAAAASEPRIEATLGNGKELGVKLSYSYESQPLGSGLAVKQAADGFSEPFFVCNGDVITDLDLTAMLGRHQESNATLTISLAPVEDPSSYGVAQLADDERLIQFVEKPARTQAPSSWVNAGTWIFDPQVLEHIADERMDGSLERLVFPSLIADGLRVQGFPSQAYWMDVGTPDRYLQLHRDLLAGRGQIWTRNGSAPAGTNGSGSRVWPDAVIDESCLLGFGCRIGALVHIQGASVLGECCDVRERAQIKNSVIWGNCKVGAGAVVQGSILGDDVWVGDDAVVEGAVLASGAKVKRGVKLSVGARLEPNEVAG